MKANDRIKSSRVGKFLTGARLREGFTQQQIAKDLNICDEYVHEIETGKKRLPWHLVNSFCSVLKISKVKLANLRLVETNDYKKYKEIIQKEINNES